MADFIHLLLLMCCGFSTIDLAFAPSTQSPTSKPKPTPVNKLAMGLGIGLGLLSIFALVTVAMCCVCRRLAKRKEPEIVSISNGTHKESPAVTSHEEPEIVSISSGIHKESSAVTSQETREYSRLTPGSDEFPRNRVTPRNVLGEGRFGKVLKAVALDIRGLGRWDEVAIKMVKESATDAEKQDFYHELLIVKKLRKHVNVVTFLGCCTVGEPALMIMEYVSGTDLLTYLRKCRPGRLSRDEQGNTLSQKDLLSFAFQTARGLRHLENSKIVHRDVAARNVLVDKDKVCKVSDFGLARDIESADIYDITSKGPLPIRWMAPESLRDTIHTHKSDVWAYGVLLWEIVTLGSSPYPGMSVKEVITFVLEKNKQESPPQCNDEISKIMQECWEFKASDRPSFDDVIVTFEQILEDEGDYIRLENMGDGLYEILEGLFTDEKL
ncbi:tyrosine kinase receptor Cad96Ca-like [Gigantopelta aegis]|uniref:tyrosine kinase receptor Cad96Ca-like n=1 Tax=Gigantopelta aegis TaxID=1735272 RepID=UPI001B8880CE|nr:tyrosine kinase receptor Cad96Ca-like [Gigantopelta aegis]